MQFARATMIIAMAWGPGIRAHSLRNARDAAGAEACEARDLTSRALIQSQLVALDPTCEAMCKKIGAYPDCQCPGFNGQPASTEDTRSCAGKYCKSGVDSCPTDSFVTCVKEKTNVGVLLQWDDLVGRVGQVATSLLHSTRRSEELDLAHDITRRVLLQAKVNALAPTCEAMCKKIGAYPDCQCPGFNGQPASTEDTRSCAGKYCKSGVDSCPTDSFVTCVKEKTNVGVLLQWDELLSAFDQGAKRIAHFAAL